MAKRGRPAGVKNKGNAIVDKLNIALDFIAPAAQDCIYIGAEHVEAFNGVLSIGAPVTTGIERLCPHFALLRAAIKRSGETVAMTKIDEFKLSVTGGKFRAIVPCLQEEVVPLEDQNEKKYPIDDTIRQGFELIGPIVKEGGVTMIEASLLLQANSMIATDRHVMMEFWHGHSMPTVVVPKIFINAVINAKKKIIAFGYGDVSGTITFYFEDNSWIQTRLFNDPWPDCGAVLNRQHPEPRPIPEGMFEAVASLTEFAQDGDIFFGEHAIRSNEDLSQGASYEFPNAPVVNVAFNAKRLGMFAGKVTHIAFSQEHGCAFLYGNQPRMRGCIVQRQRRAAVEDDRPIPPEFQAPEAAAAPEPQPVGSLAGLSATATPAPAPVATTAVPEPRYFIHPESDVAWLTVDGSHPGIGDGMIEEVDRETYEKFTAQMNARAEQAFPDYVWSADDGDPEWDFSDVPAFVKEPFEGKQEFNLAAHNERAAANMASADPMAAAYPGIGEAVKTESGATIRKAV